MASLFPCMPAGQLQRMGCYSACPLRAFALASRALPALPSATAGYPQSAVGWKAVQGRAIAVVLCAIGAVSLAAGQVHTYLVKVAVSAQATDPGATPPSDLKVVGTATSGVTPPSELA